MFEVLERQSDNPYAYGGKREPKWRPRRKYRRNMKFETLCRRLYRKRKP